MGRLQPGTLSGGEPSTAGPAAAIGGAGPILRIGAKLPAAAERLLAKQGVRRLLADLLSLARTGFLVIGTAYPAVWTLGLLG